MFLSANLQRVRTLYGYSRKDLSEALGISEQAVWQFENQMTNPSFETILRLKKMFGVKTSYFYQEIEEKRLFKEDKIAYREADMISRKKTIAEVEYLNTSVPIINFLESYLNVPINTIIGLRDTILKRYYHSERITHDDIQEISELAREKLSIAKDNSNLLYQLEKSGIHIIEKDIGGKADAYSAWSNDGEISIIVLGKRKSATRRNFDLAHELGHLLMHGNKEFLVADKKEYKQLEIEANLFASYFLLPEKDFVKDFSELKQVSNPNSYIGLKRKYNVSIQALEMRAFKLGLISSQQNVYFYRLLAKNGYREREPLDEEMILRRPGKIRNVMQLVFSNELISLAEFQEKMHIESTYLGRLFMIEEEFFHQFQEKEAFSTYGRVISAKFS